ASLSPTLLAALKADDVRFLASFGPLMGLSTLLIIRAVWMRHGTVGVAAAGLAGLTLIASVAAALAGQSWLHGLMALLVLAGSGSVVQRCLTDLVDGILVAAVSMCTMLGAYAVLLPQFSIRTDCQDNLAKCELLGGFISVGQGSGSNAFAITLV